jgi:hypothetical protein
MSLVADPVRHDTQRPAADRFMRSLLRVQHAPPASARQARSAFRTSVVVAGVRCLLTYIVLPFVLPFVGLAAGVAPVVGAIIGVVAVVCIVSSMRRFWRADHRARWGYTAFGAGMITFLLVLVVRDLLAIG